MISNIRYLSRKFGFIKNLGEKGSKESVEIASFLLWKDLRRIPNQQGSIDIDLSKLKIQYTPDTKELQTNVPMLKHGLDKYLNGELVFGDQNIGNLPQANDEKANKNVAQISGYIKPSKDQTLMTKGYQSKCKYISSTSSISSPLVALYYIFSCFRLPQTQNLFQGYPNKPLNWMISFRKPTTFFLYKLKNGIQVIQSDHGILPQENKVLMNLGLVIEYFLTHEKQETERLLKGEKIKDVKNYYRYASVNDQIMLRSQIDCMSYDKDGKPFVFEIKSRACAPIRYDIANYEQYKDYEINSKRGLYESFQRQYFDLIRGGFLKYVMQVKIGRMDGAFIAYHNTQKLYGFQYVKMKQMALRVFGDEYNLDVAFVCTCKMLTIILNHLRKTLSQYGEDTLKIGFYSDYKTCKLIVMVEVMSVVKQYVILKQKPENVNKLMDYFTHHQELKNPIYKFQFDFFIYLNGLKLNNSQILLTPLDTLQMKYKASEARRISVDEYLFFLHCAYKDQQIFNSSIYRGMWGYGDTQAE